MNIDEFNIKIDTELYGTLELLPGLTLNDMKWLQQAEIKALSARELAVQLIQKHLVSPEFDQAAVQAWPDDLLAEVATSWFDEQQEDSSLQAAEPFSWETFKAAVYAQDAGVRKRFKTTADNLLGPMVQRQLSSMLAPLIRAQAQITVNQNWPRLIAENLRPPSLNFGNIFSGISQPFADIGNLSQVWRSLATPSWTSLLGNSVLPDLQRALQAHVGLMASLAAERSAMVGLLSSQITETLHRQWDWMPSVFRQFKREYQEQVLAAFLELDLWPAPSMEESFLEQLVPLALQRNRRAATLVLWNYYMRSPAKRLGKMVASWADDPEYAARKHILDQALTAHQQKLYAVAIPALLAQLEGIASDFAYRNGLLTASGGMRLGKTGRIVQGVLEVAGQADTMDGDEIEVMEFVAVGAIIQYVQQVAFETLDFLAQYEALRQRRDLNRHGILHGIQINYPSAMNSLRCFLLLDTLYGFRNQAKGAEGAA